MIKRSAQSVPNGRELKYGVSQYCC